MRRLLLALLAVVALLPAPGVAAVPPRTSWMTDGVLVVGVPGLTWDRLGPETPALSRLAEQSARGVLSVKGPGAVTCEADAWLTLGAGNRARAEERSGPTPCRRTLWDARQIDRLAAEDGQGAEPFALHAALLRAGQCLTASGASTAFVDPRKALDASTAGGGAGSGTQGSAACRVRVVGTPPVSDDAPARADDAVAAALRDLPRGWLVLVVGLPTRADGRAPQPRLHVALITGSGEGALRSASTRRAPYVQLVDVAPTVLDRLALPQPREMVGQPWTAPGRAPSAAQLADLDRKAQGYRSATVPFVVASLALLLVALVLARRRPRALHAVALAGTALPAASYLAMLVPWWRADPAWAALLAVAVALAAAVAALALRVPGRLGPVAAVLVGTASLLVVDLLTGAHLQMESPFGYSSLVAGRFAGIGNVAFGVLAAAALLGAALLPVRAAVALLAAVVLVDGAPPFGSDVGGVLALVPAVVLLLALRTGRRVSLPLLGAAGAGGVLLVSVLAAFDLSRPEERRTHLGRFARQLLDGEGGTVLRRKAGAVLDLLFANPVTALLPLVVAAAVLLVIRAPGLLGRAFAAFPQYRQGIAAVGLASLLGFLLNDSGAAVPALALVVALPATVAVVSATVSRAAPAPSSASLASRTPDEAEPSG